MLEEIKAALHDAEAELLRVESAAPAAALRSVTGQPEDGDQALLEGLPGIRATVDRLRLALAGAEQAEADRKEAEKARLLKAAGAATRQHLGRVSRGAEKASRAIIDLADAFVEISEGRRAAIAAMPAAARAGSDLDYRISDERLGRAILVEIGRCLRAAGVHPPTPLTHFTADFSANGRVVPLVEIVSRCIAGVKGMLPVIERPSSKSVAIPAAVTEAGAAGASVSVPHSSPGSPNSDILPGDEPSVLLCAAGGEHSSPESPQNVVVLGDAA